MEEGWIKTTTSPQVGCRTTFWKVNVLLCSFTSMGVLYSENNMLHVGLHPSRKLLFAYLSFLPDTDVIIFRYFVCCITHTFQLWRWTFGTAFNKHNDLFIDKWRPRVKTCMPYVPKADILITSGKLICVDKEITPSWIYVVIQRFCITINWTNCAVKLGSWKLTFCMAVR